MKKREYFIVFESPDEARVVENVPSYAAGKAAMKNYGPGYRLTYGVHLQPKPYRVSAGGCNWYFNDVEAAVLWGRQFEDVLYYLWDGVYRLALPVGVLGHFHLL